MTPAAVAVILAAGAGARLGRDAPKAFLELAGRPMLAMAAEAAAACPSVVSLVVAVPAGLEARARSAVGGPKPVTVISGGPSRHASVRAALPAVPDGVTAVVCHDAARPFASTELFTLVVASLEGFDGAIPVTPVPDTIKRVRGGVVARTEGRTELAIAQTPQAFVSARLREAHARAADADLEFTDDSAVMEWAGFRVRAVPGEPGNFKVTTIDDYVRAELAASEGLRG